VIGSTRRVKVFAYGAPVDMRKQFDALSALVVGDLKHDVLDGDLFLFVSKSRKRAKVLYFDGTGLCLFAKRLEKGHFAALWGEDATVATMTTSELALFIEGSELVGRKPLSPEPFVAERDGRVRFPPGP
jgi:transposase